MNPIARVLLAIACAWLVLTAAAPLHAQSYCSSSSTNMNYEWISRVEINGAERTSGKEGFNDQTGASLTTLAIGGTYPVEVDVSTGGGPWLEYVKIWFDLNHDGVFADPGELIFNESKTVPANSMATFNANIVIPGCSLPGETRLRIIMQYNANPSLCGTYTYGETEDYIVTVTGSSAVPTSSAASFSMAEDTTHTFSLSSFPFADADPGQSMKSVVIASLPSSGTLERSGVAVAAGQSISAGDLSSGRLTYRPTANGNGTPYDTFTFRVTDCVDQQSAAHTMTANVTAVNDAPTISAIANQTMNENESLGPISFEVGDADTGAASVVVSATSSNESLVPASSIQLAGTGAARTIAITPQPNRFGAATITLTASDGALTASRAFQLTVNGVNDAPVLAKNTGATLAQGATAAITSAMLQVTDADNAPSELVYTVTTASTRGTLRAGAAALGAGSTFSQASIDGGALSYENGAGGATSDSFRFTVSDGAGGTIAERTFSILVQPFVSIGDVSTTETDSISTVSVPVTLSGTWPVAIDVSFSTADGTATAGIDYSAATGIATVPAGSSGTTIPITILGDEVMKLARAFQVELSSPSAGTLETAAGTVTIEDDDPMPTLSITGGSAKEGHAATSEAAFVASLSTPSGLDVTFDYATADGSAVSPGDYGATTGSATIPAGSLSASIVVPISGDHEVEDDESFSMQLTNVANATPSSSGATWTIVSDDHAPVANNDSFQLDEDEVLSVDAPGIVGNDDDLDGDTLTIHVTTQPSHGALSLSGDGSFTYTPDENDFGSDSFAYQLSDGHFDSNVATVSLQIDSVNDAPLAADDSATTPEDTSLTIAATALLENDTDVEENTLTIVSVASPTTAGGTVSLVDGSVAYEPAADFGGSDSFVYTISDGNGGTATARVDVTVTRLVDVAVSISGPEEVTPGTEHTWTVTLSNAGPSDADGLTLEVPTPDGLILVGDACDPCAPLALAEDASTTVGLTWKIPSSWTGGGTVSVAATAMTTIDEANAADNAGTFLTTITNPVADLAVEIDAPDEMIPGTEVEWVVTATNAGPSDAASAGVSLELPASFTESSRTCSSGCTGTVGQAIAAGGTLQWTIRGVVDPSARGEAVARATLSVEEPAADPVHGNDDASHLATLTPMVRLVPSISHDREPAVLDRSVEWTLSLLNEGPSTATGIAYELAVEELDLESPESGAFASLLPGERAEVVVGSIATALPRAALSASLTATEPLEEGESASVSDEVSVRVPLADLRASVTPLVAATRVGERFELEILVTNDGPEEAMDAVLTLDEELRARLETLSIEGVDAVAVTNVPLGTIEAGETVALRGEAWTREAGLVTLTFRGSSAWDDPDPETGSATLLLDADTTTRDTIIPLAEDGIDETGRQKSTVVALANLGFVTSRVVLSQTPAGGGNPMESVEWLEPGESRPVETPSTLHRTPDASLQSGWIRATAGDVSRVGVFQSSAWTRTVNAGVESYGVVLPGAIEATDVWLHGLVDDERQRAVVAVVNTDPVHALELDLDIHPADGSLERARSLRVSVAPSAMGMFDALAMAGLESASVQIRPRTPWPVEAAYVAWAMMEDRQSGDRIWRAASSGSQGAVLRVAAIPPAGDDELLLTVANPSEEPITARLTIGAETRPEIALSGFESRTIDLSGFAVESEWQVLRVEFADAAGDREGFAWTTARRGAAGGGWLLDETEMPRLDRGAAAGTFHPGEIERNRSARVLVVNANEAPVHVTISVHDAGSGELSRYTTAVVPASSARLLDDMAPYLLQQPGYLRFETSGGERVHARLVIDPAEGERHRIDSLVLAPVADE